MHAQGSELWGESSGFRVRVRERSLWCNLSDFSSKATWNAVTLLINYNPQVKAPDASEAWFELGYFCLGYREPDPSRRVYGCKMIRFGICGV